MDAVKSVTYHAVSNGMKNFNSYLPFWMLISKNLKHAARFAAPSPQSKESKVHSKKDDDDALEP